MSANDLPIPSQELANKRNVNESIDRFIEATAEDFAEIAYLFNALRNYLQGRQYVDDDLFLGSFTNASILEASYPTPEENSYAFIKDNSSSPVTIAAYTDVNGWVYSSVNTKLFVYVDSVSDLPSVGDSTKIYVVTRDKSYYHYLNNEPVLFGSQSSVKSVNGVGPNADGNVIIDLVNFLSDSLDSDDEGIGLSLKGAKALKDLIPTTTSDLPNDKSIITINDFEEITEEGTYRIEYSSSVDYPRTNVLNLEDNSEVNFVSTFTTSGFDTELLSGWFNASSRYSFIIDAKRVESVFEDLTPLLVPKTYTQVASYIDPTQAEQETIKQGNYTNGDIIKVTITQNNFEVLRVGNPSGKDFSVDIFYQYQENEIVFNSGTRTEVRFNPVFEDSIITLTNGDINDFNVEGNYRTIFSTSLEVLGEYTDYYEEDEDDGFYIDSEDGYGGSPSYITDNTSLLKLAFPTDVVFIPQAPKSFAITGEIRFQNTNKRIGVYYSSDVNSLAFGNPIIYMDVDYIMDSELKNVYSINQDYFIKYNTDLHNSNFVDGFLEIKNIHTSLKNIGARKASLQYNSGDNLSEHIDVNCGVLLDDVENSSNFISVIEDKSGRFTNQSVFSEVCVKVIFDRTLTRSNIYRTYKTGKNALNIEFDGSGSHHRRMIGWNLWAFYAATNGIEPDYTVHFAPSSRALSSKSLDYYAKKYDANVMSLPTTSLSYITPTQVPDDVLLCYSLGSNANQLEMHENNWLPAQYYKNVVVVRGGLLNEKHSETTSSWGIGTTFTEQTSPLYLEANSPYYNHEQALLNKAAGTTDANVYNNYKEGVASQDSATNNNHDQSPAAGQLAGKVKAIEKLSGISDLGIIVEAMIATADRNNRFIHDVLETNQYITNYKNVLDINIDLIDIEDDFQGDDFNIVIDGVVQTSKIYTTNTINILGSELSSITEEGSYLLEVVKVTNSELVYSQNISIWETTSFTGDYSTIDNRWNPFDGYGTVNDDNAVAWLNDTTEGSNISKIKVDGLKALKNQFEMPSVYSYEDKSLNMTITKRDFENKMLSLSKSFTDTGWINSENLIVAETSDKSNTYSTFVGAGTSFARYRIKNEVLYIQVSRIRVNGDSAQINNTEPLFNIDTSLSASGGIVNFGTAHSGMFILRSGELKMYLSTPNDNTLHSFNLALPL